MGSSADPMEATAEDLDDPDETFVEVDPTGRYGRYNEVLGTGAFKNVYKAFDRVEGIEVAWYQVHFNFARPESMDRLYFEVNLLKRMKHKSIIKFYNSWVDHDARNVNFITECFTSGTLREYRAKHKKVNLKAVKSWARQILQGLVYMHTHDPPIVHRDLKCDNIFVNGNHGEVKIGDLGLATILREAQVCRSVIGTPEFMAPELYDEMYNELVDIYAFGMCVLELVTLEYPYSECTNAAQIMRKVREGTKPLGLNKIKDPQIRQFVEKCIAPVSERLSAQELLLDPFLQCEPELEEGTSVASPSAVTPSPQRAVAPPLAPATVSVSKQSACDGTSASTSSSSSSHIDDQGFQLKGEMMQNGNVALSLRYKVKGKRNTVNFTFDLEADSAFCVATEMVELDLSADVTAIAQAIDDTIVSLVPAWKPGGAFDDDEAGNEGDTEELVDNTEMSADEADDGTVEEFDDCDEQLDAKEHPKVAQDEAVTPRSLEVAEDEAGCSDLLEVPKAEPDVVTAEVVDVLDERLILRIVHTADDMREQKRQDDRGEQYLPSGSLAMNGDELQAQAAQQGSNEQNPLEGEAAKQLDFREPGPGPGPGGTTCNSKWWTRMTPNIRWIVS